MEDNHTDAALPKGEESPREPASQKNESPHPARSQHAAKSKTGAEGPQSAPEGQPEPHKEKGKPGRLSPFDPFWDTEIVPQLEQDLKVELTPAGMLDNLVRQHPKAFKGKIRKSLLRTLGRSMKMWRKKHRRYLPVCCPRSRGIGRRKRRMIFLPQEHPGGREAQVDFTDCRELEVTIQGKPFPHELFDFRLSHSGWTHVEVFLGETVSALMQGLQNALRELGGVPEVVRSDNRRNGIRNKQPIEPYKAFLRHYGLKLSLINYGRPNENGGVEGENFRVKEGIRQALLSDGSRDFESEEDYAVFVRRVVDSRNREQKVQHRLREERASLRPLPETPAPEFIEKWRTVSDRSLIEVYSCRYSVPCQAVGQRVRVRLYAERLEVYDKKGRLVTWKRRHGNDEIAVNYCHLFPDLLAKWGGFAGLPADYKQQLFPRPSFRMTHEKLLEWDPNGPKTNGLNADYQYVRILDLASEADQEGAVDQALQRLLKAGHPFDFEDVRGLLDPPPEAPEGLDPPERKDHPPRQAPLL